MRKAMKNLLRLPEKGEKGNDKSSLPKWAGKQLIAVALAFSTQYGGILQTQSADAAQKANTHVSQMQQTPELAQLDHNYMLVDEERTLKGGLALMLGAPVIVFPVQDATSGERYIMVHEDGTSGHADVPTHAKALGKAMGADGLKDIYPDSQQFMDFTQEQLDGVQLTSDEKRRIYFARAFFWSSMTQWKHREGDGNKEGISTGTDIINQNFDTAVASFKALDDGSEWFQERLKDIEVFRATSHTASLWAATFATKAVSRDIDNYSRRVGYVATIQRAAQIMQERTKTYLTGHKPKSEFMMDQAIFGRLADFNLRYLKRLPEKGWFADQRFRDAMASIEAILPVFQQAFDAVGTGTELQNLQQAREQVVHAEQLLGYQAILASSAYSYPGITSEELNSWANKNFQTAQALLHEHGVEKLHLPSELGQTIQQAQFAYFQVAPKYELLASAANTGQKLRALFAQVEGQKGVWSAGNKAKLQQIYSAALNSPSDQAQREFVAVLREGIKVSHPNVRIKPFEETGLTQNYALSPINREINGVVMRTTEHPVDTVEAKFSLENTLPIPLRVTFVMELSGADNPRDVREVWLHANKIADIHYIGHVSITQTRRGGGNATPRADLQVAMNGVQEVASGTWGEQIASLK